ncbi:D-glucuronyl C5-epimerase [Thermococcus sp. EP1]|uniref:D-glucuronyl C5-epimerase family protein n=1 Tax=Thermococcus sp. EP1 TaxID=1591054 RepID=UPI0006DAE7BD|nr:D-glucuronyl C5-epimerase family protein [Thermococcus sp. EP1]KPU63692.1 D-glucuronyl C5-epimerase [Thermococcus sp. EP1]
MKEVKIITFIAIMMLSLGCITVEDNISHSPPNEKVEVYIQVEEKSAVFEFSSFQVEIGNKTISELNKPVFVGYVQKKDNETEIIFVANVKATDWYGKKVTSKKLIALKLPAGEKALVTLELYYEDETLMIKVNPYKSGIIGKTVPEEIFMSPEEALMKRLQEIYGEIPPKISEEIQKNREIREKFLEKYTTTGNLTYLRTYRDSFYVIRVFGEMAKWKKLTALDVKAFNVTLKANNEYYSLYPSPQRDFSVVIFSKDTPYYSPIRIEGSLNISLPFLYYKGRGLSYYPVSALHWAEIYFQRGSYEKALRILNDLHDLIYYGEYNGEEYALFLNYFHFENSSIPWVSGYAQGMGAGLYAKAYQLTGKKEYLNIAKLLLNSFDLPLDMNGFVANTKYGPWYLEYNYNSNELVLNGHVIALQGIYYYWEVTKDEKAWKLFQEGVESTKKGLQLFDTGSWSKYSNIHGDASEFYHRLHIRLLKWLYDVTNDEYFLHYAEKWNDYLIYRGLPPEKLR